MRRVLGYASGYKPQIGLVLITILVISSLTALQPLVVGSLIDDAIPDGDMRHVAWLGAALVGVAIVNGATGVAQRRASAAMGEGIIFDLRRQLYGHLPADVARFLHINQNG